MLDHLLIEIFFFYFKRQYLFIVYCQCWWFCKCANYYFFAQVISDSNVFLISHVSQFLSNEKEVSCESCFAEYDIRVDCPTLSSEQIVLTFRGMETNVCLTSLDLEWVLKVSWMSLEFSLMLVVSDYPELVIMPGLNWATVTVQNHMRIRVVEMRNNLLDKLSEKIRGQSWSNGLNLDSAWLEVEDNKGGHDETGWELMSLCNWVSCGIHIVRSSIFNSFLWVNVFVGKNELDLLIRI